MKTAFTALMIAVCTSVVAEARTMNKTNISGKTTKLDFVTSLNPDCTPTGETTVRVLQAPTLGQIKILKTKEFAYYKPGNPRQVCNTRRVSGVRVDYTSRPGVSGQDYIVLEVITSLGLEVRSSYYVTVK